MTDVVEFRLGEEALAYIRTTLAAGKALASLMLHEVTLDAGRVVTYLPKGTDPQAATRFNAGGVLPSVHAPTPSPFEGHPPMVPVPNADGILAEFIRDYLTGGDRVSLLEDAMAQRGDPNLERLNTRFFFFRRDVYHYLTAQDDDREVIRRTIRAAKSNPVFVGALTTVPASVRLQDRGELEELDFRVLAHGVEKIFVGAYDGEGYLFWHKHPR